MKKINYLTLILASAVLTAIMFFGEIYRAYPPFLVLTIITFLISLVNLFLIHHKNLQQRLCIYNAIVLLAYQIWIVWLLWSIKKNSGLSLQKFPISVVFPIICVILNVLAASIIRRTIAAEEFMKTLRKAKKNGKIQKNG